MFNRRINRHAVIALTLCVAAAALGQQGREDEAEPAERGEQEPAQASYGTDRDDVRTMPEPTPPPSPRDPRLPPDGGSLYAQQSAAIGRRDTLASASLFTVGRPEPRLFTEHELITIVVREDSRAGSEAEAETEKSAFLRAQLRQFIRLNLDDLSLDDAVTGTVPTIDITGSGGWEGEGEFERSDRFQARVTAEIIDIKPNGNLVLAGRKRITHDREEQVFLITGVVRADDVTADNTVLSTQMADLDLRKFTGGQIADAVKKGLLPRLYDKVNPF
jgi:flagellar L-ring protein precursor FlgH